MAKKKPSQLKKNIRTIRKIKNLRRSSMILLIVLAVSAVSFFIVLAGGIVTSAGGYLVLFQPESLQKSYTGDINSLGGSRGTTGMPQLLPGSRFYMPIDQGRVTSLYGYRNTGIEGASEDHKGMDIAVGDAVVTIYPGRPGKVIAVQLNNPPPSTTRSKGSMQSITIEHDVEGLKFFTWYAHIFRSHVQVGDIVNMDTPIGIVGNTGVSSGPHLHYEIRKGTNSRNNAVPHATILYCGDQGVSKKTNVASCFALRGSTD